MSRRLENLLAEIRALSEEDQEHLLRMLAANVSPLKVGEAAVAYSSSEAKGLNGMMSVDSVMSWESRITFDPRVMGGKPCIRGMRVTVGTIVGLLAAGRTEQEILSAYPYLEPEDLRAALTYAAWRAEERDIPIASG